MKRLKSWLGVFAIFFFGVIFGIAITAGLIHEEVRKLVDGGPEKVVDVIVSRLKKDLHLDQNQQEMLQHIAVSTRIELSTIRQQTQPQVAQTLDKSAHDVRGILNPEQVKKFDEIIRTTRARWNIDREVPKSSPPPATPSPENAEPAAKAAP